MVSKIDRCLTSNKHVEYIRKDCRDSTDYSLFIYNSNRYDILYIVRIIGGPDYHGEAGRYWTVTSQDELNKLLDAAQAQPRYSKLHTAHRDELAVYTQKQHKTMLQYAKFGCFLAGISAAITQGGQLLFGIAKAIRTMIITVGNETFKTYPMTCPAYSKIIDTRFSSINEIMLAIQFMSAFVVSSAIVSVCSLAEVLAMHVRGQLNVLYTWLNELVNDYEEKRNQSAEHKLAVIVEHHLRVLRYYFTTELWLYLL